LGPSFITRRSWLVSSAAALSCARRKATRYLGYCFVANQGGRSVAVVDLNRFSVRAVIALEAAPGIVIAHPSQPKVFVATPETGTVCEIDAASLAVTRRARAGSQIVGVQLAPGRDSLWVLYRDPAVLVEFPLASLRPGRRIRLPGPPDTFDLSVRGQAAISIRSTRSIVLASLATGSIERTIAAGADPTLVRYQPLDGNQLIAGSHTERSLAIFDALSGKTVVRLPVAVAPRNFCFDPSGGQLFVTGDGMDAVVIVFPYSSEVDQTILAGRAPGTMAVTDSYLLVANPDTDSITVLSIDTRTLVSVVQVGRGPRFILITPDKQYALVLNESSGDLAVIRLYSLAVTPKGSPRWYKSAPLFTMFPVGEQPVSAAVVALT
jgi:DNA-binding beta-propeller fold protein YncE